MIEHIIGEEFYQIVQKNSIITYLQKIPLFSFLPFTKLEWVSEAFSKQKFRENQTIINQDSQGTSFFVIHKGEVDIFIQNKKITTLSKGDYFEEKSLLLNEPYSVTAVAVEPSTLFILHRADFTKEVEPALRKFMLKRLKLVSNVNTKLEDLHMIEKIAQGSFKTVYEVEDKVNMQRYALKVVNKAKVKKYNLQAYL